MFLICDAGPGRKGSGRLNPNKQTMCGADAPCATTSSEGSSAWPGASGGVQRMCQELAAARGQAGTFPEGPMDGQGGSAPNFPSGDGVKKAACAGG